MKQLGADKAEVDKRLSSEEQKVFQSQSLVQQVSAANKKLEADLANLQVNKSGVYLLYSYKSTKKLLVQKVQIQLPTRSLKS
jgi:hypothetical protein